MAKQSRFPIEIRERAVRLVLENSRECGSQVSPLQARAGGKGAGPEGRLAWRFPKETIDYWFEQNMRVKHSRQVER